MPSDPGNRQGRPSRDARWIAATVLGRVTEDGAFASAALAAELGRARPDRRDASLATEILYGTLRILPAIDEILAPRLRKPLASLDPFARAVLRTAIYQLGALDRVPARAVVHASVELVRRARGPALGGLVNAILRRVSEGPLELPSFVLPPWFEGALVDAVGASRAATFQSPPRTTPPLCLRVRKGLSRELVAEQIKESSPSVEVQLGSLAERSLLLWNAGDPRALPGYARGDFSVQEQGAQALVEMVRAEGNLRVADVCAGRGGKTVALLETVGPGARVDATDLDERKLEAIPEEVARLGLAGDRVSTRPVDFSVGTGGAADDYDLVFVDAPCSGLGTVHRRPEILLRVGPQDPARMADLQGTILANAARLVAPGGRLVFVVCSPLRVEGDAVAQRFEADHPTFVRAKDLPGAEGDGILRIGPWMDQCDAYQAILWHHCP